MRMLIHDRGNSWPDNWISAATSPLVYRYDVCIKPRWLPQTESHAQHPSSVSMLPMICATYTSKRHQLMSLRHPVTYAHIGSVRRCPIQSGGMTSLLCSGPKSAFHAFPFLSSYALSAFRLRMRDGIVTMVFWTRIAKTRGHNRTPCPPTRRRGETRWIGLLQAHSLSLHIPPLPRLEVFPGVCNPPIAAHVIAR